MDSPSSLNTVFIDPAYIYPLDFTFQQPSPEYLDPSDYLFSPPSPQPYPSSHLLLLDSPDQDQAVMPSPAPTIVSSKLPYSGINPNFSFSTDQMALPNVPVLESTCSPPSSNFFTEASPTIVSTGSSSRNSSVSSSSSSTSSSTTTTASPSTLGSESVTPTLYKPNIQSPFENQQPMISPSGPVPATIPTSIYRDQNGIDWISFVYSKDRIKTTNYIRCDIESVNISTDLTEDFKRENCIYPRARVAPSQYKGNRQKYETECNCIGWCLVYINPHLRAQRGLIQRAVDSWRNTNANPSLRSRRVRRMSRRQEKLKHAAAAAASAQVKAQYPSPSPGPSATLVMNPPVYPDTMNMAVGMGLQQAYPVFPIIYDYHQ